MNYLVGYTPDRSGSDALSLGEMLVHGTSVALDVCMVMPETWDYPSPARVDAEYKQFLSEHARKSLDKVHTLLSDDVQTHLVSVAANSAAAGLAQVAEENGSDLIILGSPRDGPMQRCAFGSVASALIALTKRPLALTPRGFNRKPKCGLQRVTCAYVDDRRGDRTVTAAASLAHQHNVPLRLVTFIVRDRQMYPSAVGYQAENMVSNAWREQATAAQQAAIANLPHDVTATATIGDGPDWRRALTSVGWMDGEVLVAGAHPTGTLSGFLFGSGFMRLLRYASVPVVAVP